MLRPLLKPSDSHPLPWTKTAVRGELFLIEAANGERVLWLPFGEGSDKTADFLVAAVNAMTDLITEVDVAAMVADRSPKGAV